MDSIKDHGFHGFKKKSWIGKKVHQYVYSWTFKNHELKNVDKTKYESQKNKKGEKQKQKGKIYKKKVKKKTKSDKTDEKRTKNL